VHRIFNKIHYLSYSSQDVKFKRLTLRSVRPADLQEQVTRLG
jgi:hypothetical protein